MSLFEVKSLVIFLSLYHIHYIVHSVQFAISFNILDDGSEDGKCSVGGVAGYVFNVLLDQTRHLAKYVSYTVSQFE